MRPTKKKITFDQSNFIFGPFSETEKHSFFLFALLNDSPFYLISVNVSHDSLTLSSVGSVQQENTLTENLVIAAISDVS